MQGTCEQRSHVFLFLHPKKFLKIGDSGSVAVSDGQMLKGYFLLQRIARSRCIFPERILHFQYTSALWKYKIFRRKDMKKKGVIKIEIFVIL